ncbi:hypothetical protein H6G52_05110 [Limnothrix sp. FACHB-881]|uniref:hypothetical protein n=1 Tax=Limnothrix sp. FACHB-881 TaxID=2692819 RepID=UPI0016824104|nr:hypothetical protein [Limnothrix sp. FACHB-881]MBD2634733.1 hypothetical protein [Limnothrix sp. FACHB-881]
MKTPEPLLGHLGLSSVAYSFNLPPSLPNTLNLGMENLELPNPQKMAEAVPVN